jgi:hypothetical protein
VHRSVGHRDASDRSVPRPADWTWIIACDEAAWHRVEMQTGQANVSGKILGTTDLENHVTYIRGFAILHPFNDTAEAQPG